MVTLIIALGIVLIFGIGVGIYIGRWDVRDYESMGTIYIDPLEETTYLELEADLKTLSKMRGAMFTIKTFKD